MNEFKDAATQNHRNLQFDFRYIETNENTHTIVWVFFVWYFR